MRNVILFFILFASFSAFSSEREAIVLTNTSIGNMPIKVAMPISLYKIRNYFPFYRVTQQIREGDSPDYHLFEVSTHEGESLISFISYIDEADGYEKGIVKLDEVIIHSSKIRDQFGLTPDMSISIAIAKRKDLKFGTGHMDNYLGNGKIWYMFSVNKTHGAQVTEQMAMNSNSKITTISWPHPWWN
jgi:hypothetical protein